VTDVYASIDLGGTKIAGALATTAGAVLAQAVIPTESYGGPPAVLARIAGLVAELAAAAGVQPRALGLGVPGLADLHTGVVKFLPNLPTQWREVPAGAYLREALGCPVRLLNDVRMATLGELVYGHGQAAPGQAVPDQAAAGAMIFFALGTGIGGGLAIDGRLYLGPMGASAEFGHMTVVPDGPACSCGSRGCLEIYAGGPAITGQGIRLLLAGQTTCLYDLVEGRPERVNPAVMAQAAAAGDQRVAAVLTQAAEYLGIAVANAILMVHPRLVVLGGSVAEIGPLLFDTVRAVVNWRVGMFSAADIAILPSQLGSRAGLWGGIALAAGTGIE
jgi:glucokinase